MLFIDFEGPTVEDTINIATKELNLGRDKLQIEVLSKGKKSFFGVGKKKLAQIRVYYKEENKIGDLLNEIKTIVGFLDREAVVKINQQEENLHRYKINVHSKQLNHLIGKRGQHLKSLQIIVNSLLQRHDNNYKIIVDIGNYNKKREQELIDWVKSKAEQVLKSKKPLVLRSFNSYKRRLIHLELKNFKNLVSESKGEGKSKNIKISYSEK